MAGVIRREARMSTASFSLADLAAQGRALVAQAEARAADILHRAEDDAQRLAEERRREGFERGLAEGRAAGLQQLRTEARDTVLREQREHFAQLSSALATALADFDRARRRLLALAEQGLVDLAVAVAARACKLAAGATPRAALENARQAVALVAPRDDLELRFHPADLELLRAAAPGLVTGAAELAHARLVADERVTRGGCLLTSAAGEVDATLETQLERIAEALGASLAASGAVDRSALPTQTGIAPENQP